jgi:hypothetical protein
MTIELSSPYFVSGNNTEDFEIIVMQHKKDNTKSIAIDEFPNMDEKISRQFLNDAISGFNFSHCLNQILEYALLFPIA